MRPVTRPALLTLLLAGCAAAPGPGSAPTPARVRLLAGAGAREVVRALERKPYLRLTVETPDRRLQARLGGTPAPRSDAAGDARRALARAREAYRAIDFQRALTILNQAQASLAGAAQTPAAFAALGQIALRRGLNHLARKDLEAAQGALATAISLGADPRPGEYPPEVEAALSRVKEQLAGSTRGSITVSTTPAGASVWMDGKDRGQAPVTLKAPPGLHHLRIGKPGHGYQGMFHLIAQGKLEQLKIHLKPTPAPELARELLARHRGGRPLTAIGKASPAVGLLARALGKELALLQLDRGRARVLWTGAGAGAGCRAPTPAGLARCLGPILYQLASGAPLRRSAPAPAVRPLHRKWWFWTLIAGGAAAAAGAGVGIYYGTRDAPGTAVDIMSRKD